MSDDFIPLNQSTPVQRQWNQGRNQNQSGFRNHFKNGNRGRRNQWTNNSRNNSFSSDNNSYANNSSNSYGNNSFSNNRLNIDAYLHPSMLEDPWAQLRQKRN